MVGLFLYEDFWNMIFWLVFKLEISYRVMTYLERFWFLLEDFEKKIGPLKNIVGIV